MNLTSKYNLTQLVWGVRRNANQRIVKCSPCRNTGKITIDGEPYLCPKCQGRANYPVPTEPRCYVSDYGKIGRIQITVYDPVCREEDESKLSVEYMLDSTGVGSGTIWHEHELFETEAEAEAFCVEQNKNIPPDEK